MDYQKLNTLLGEVLSGAHDKRFLDVVEKVHCMSRPRVYAVINAIVSSMEPGELYLEVGTYQGGSLISALKDNQALAYGVDSFSEFSQTNSLERTQGNLAEFGVSDRVKLHNMSFQEFFAHVDPGFRAQVYNYDGAHNYETQLSGLESALPFLSAGSLIIVDDYLYPEVYLSLNKFISNHIDKVRIQFLFGVEKNSDETWWNGVCVLRVM